MATVTVIIITALTAGCVVSQSTVDDNESSSQAQLELQLAQLQQQHHQMAQVLSDILDRQHQQLKKLNELQAMLTNRPAVSPTFPTMPDGGKIVFVSLLTRFNANRRKAS